MRVSGSALRVNNQFYAHHSSDITYVLMRERARHLPLHFRLLAIASRQNSIRYTLYTYQYLSSSICSVKLGTFIAGLRLRSFWSDSFWLDNHGVSAKSYEGERTCAASKTLCCQYLRMERQCVVFELVFKLRGSCATLSDIVR